MPLRWSRGLALGMNPVKGRRPPLRPESHPEGRLKGPLLPSADKVRGAKFPVGRRAKDGLLADPIDWQSRTRHTDNLTLNYSETKVPLPKVAHTYALDVQTAITTGLR